MMKVFEVIPLLVMPAVLFIMISLGSGSDAWVAGSALAIPMPTGHSLGLTLGDLFQFLAVVVLFIEIIKSVSTDARGIINHGLSVLLMIACLILLLTQPYLQNAEFLTLTILTLFDVAAGVTITIVAARRDIGTTAH